jgi:serine/threonine protein kinase HipA of HipAB toxin-antitoxin module
VAVEDSDRYAWTDSGMARTRQEQQELAATMRRLPGRFADRLSARALERVTGAAAAGRWEEALDELITALHARAEVITADERAELRTVLAAMNMDGDRVDGLAQHQ